ncbi:MAG: TonB-dependent receptor [Sphingomonadales bacterium]|nr:TonB-dependent receptor [Sphingomonadales bacterium]
MRQYRNTRKAWRLALLASALTFGPIGAAGTAFAQQQPAASSDQDIIVTAQRRSERLEDVPASVAVVLPETLAKAGVNNLQDIGRIAPGVQVNQSGLSTQPAIRGVTTLTNGAFNENNIGIYVDGFYVPDTLSINSDLVNVKSVEVLKGPQGTLYGRNATGGAILINTLDPEKKLTGKFEIEYGRFNELAVKGYVSVPLSDSVRLSVAAADRHGDGYIRLQDPVNPTGKGGPAAPFTQRSIRVKLQADLSPNLQATLGFNYGLSDDPRGNLYTPRYYLSAAIAALPATSRPTDATLVAYTYKPVIRALTREVTGKLAWNTPIGTLTSRTSYAWRKSDVYFDFDGSYADLYGYAVNNYRNHTFQESIDYNINAIRNVDLLVGGLYYSDYSGPGTQFGGKPITSLTNGPGLNPTAASSVTLNSKSYAIYADLTWHATPRLAINLGGRYSHDDRAVDEFIQAISGGALGAYSLPEVAKSAGFDKFTPRASIRYELAPRTNVYFTYSMGYRSGSFNANTISNAAFLIPIKPEQLNSYELGFKTVQGSVRAELAGFYYDYTNYNVSLTVPNPLIPGSVTTVLGNAPKATIYGIEGQASFTVMENTHVTVGASWLHARFGDFANAIGTGLNAATQRDISGQVQDWSNQQMSRAPNFSANVMIDHTMDLLGGKLNGSANMRYSDSYVIADPSTYGPLAGALANVQRYRQSRMALVDGQVSWTDPSGRYTVAVWGKNLTNHKYRLTYKGTSTYGDYGVRAAPITFGGRLGVSF